MSPLLIIINIIAVIFAWLLAEFPSSSPRLLWRAAASKFGPPRRIIEFPAVLQLCH